MNKLTIIIQTYDREKRFFNCLNSLLIQNNDKFEILIVDNGSSYSNNISEFLSKYLGNKKITHLIVKDNKGLVAGRNIGPQKIDTEWFCRVDDDDEAPSNFASKILREIEKDKYESLILGTYNNSLLYRWFWKIILLGNTFQNNAPYTIVMKKSDALKNPFPNCIPEDVNFPVFIINNNKTKYVNTGIIVNNEVSISSQADFRDRNIKGVNESSSYWSDRAGTINKRAQRMVYRRIIQFGLFNTEFIIDETKSLKLKKRFFIRPLLLIVQWKVFKIKQQQTRKH